jgi:hypothetical protein
LSGKSIVLDFNNDCSIHNNLFCFIGVSTKSIFDSELFLISNWIKTSCLVLRSDKNCKGIDLIFNIKRFSSLSLPNVFFVGESP